ncbi:MAG: hypothetical protein J6T16_05930 [Opitutales bacterium]|nr:hypothetical protein [Opitutales bacterium]
MSRKKDAPFSAEKYEKLVRGSMSFSQIEEEYKNAKAGPETETSRKKLRVLETVLYEYCRREELPEEYAWELLAGSKMLCTVVAIMPNKQFRKALVRAKLFGAEIKITGYVRVRSPRAERYGEGACIYARLTENFRELYHELEEESAAS